MNRNSKIIQSKMDYSKDPVSVRVTRINDQIIGKTSKHENTTLITRETLLDIAQVLYDECATDHLQKYDENIAKFVKKYKNPMRDLKRLRVNLNDFEIKNIVGRGHFGEVHMVKEKQTGDIYAMKTIRKFDNDIKRTSFEEERNIMALSTSPWLTSLQYAFQDQTYLFFVMEYHPGGDLLGLLYRQGGTLPESASTFYIAELVLALEDLHAMGYVHRDIKPDNILLDRCGHIKLADFGSVAKFDKHGLVTCGPPVGTPDYIAPEVLQCLDNKNESNAYDISCDFWSLGVLAYELVVGNTPFQGQNSTSIYAKIMNHSNNLKFPADVTLSQAYVSFVKSLVTDQKNRLSKKQLKKQDLFKTINFDTIKDQVPPYVPKITSIEDTSNFSDVQSKKKNPSIENFKKRSQFSGRNLPFVGFTFTHNPDGYEENFEKRRKNEEIISSLQKEVQILRDQIVKNEKDLSEREGMEKKLEEKTRKVENLEHVRGELEKNLASTLTECSGLKRTIQLERKERSELEQKALVLIKDAKLKWEVSEKRKVESLNLQIQQQQEKITQLTTTNKMLDEQLLNALKLEDKHKQSMEKVQDISRRSVIGIESRLKEITSETQTTITELKNKLSHEMFERNKLENKLTESEHREKQLKDKLKQSKHEYECLKSKVDESEGLIKELSRKVMELEKDMEQIEDYKKEIVTLQTSLEINQKTIKELENSNTMLQMETKMLEDHKKELVQLKRRISHLQNDRRISVLESQLNDEKERVTSLKKQLEEKENAVSENQDNRELRSKLWRTEKELGNCKVDKRILERELKDAQAEIKQLMEKIQNLNNSLEENKKSHEKALLELASFNEAMSLDLVRAKEHCSTLQEKLNNEKGKYDQEKTIVFDLKDSLKLRDNQIGALTKEIEQLTQEKQTIEKRNQNYNEEKSKLMTLVESLQKEKGSILNEVERLKQELQNKNLNLDALREACMLLEEQVVEFEKISASHMAKQQELNANTEKLINDLCKAKEETQEARKQINEEKSLKLMAETKVKRLQEDISCLQKEVSSYKEQCAHYKEYSTGLSDDLTTAEERVSELSITVKSLERTIEDRTKENNMLKEEIADYLTQIGRVKESNYKLNRQVHELEGNRQILSQRLQELERTLFEKTNYYKERELKSDATVKQQIKLIDYLQSKIDDQSNKKRTLTEVLFGSVKKENQPPVSLAMNYKDLESQLHKERQSNKQLREEIFKLKAATITEVNSAVLNKVNSVERHKSEIDSPRNKAVLEQIVHSPNSQNNELYRQNSLQRMHHNIPHRFESKLCTKLSKCHQCSKQFVIGKNTQVCKECHITVHPQCANSLPTTCGLPKGYSQHFKNSLTNMKSNNSSEGSTEEAITVNGWVKIPGKPTGWEKRYAVLDNDSIKIYTTPPSESNSSLLQTFELKPETETGKVVLEPLPSEIGVPVANSDLPFVLKIEVASESTCWPPNCLILMTLSAKEKDMWFSALKKIFKMNDKLNFDTVLSLPDDLRVNCMVDLTENIRLLGTEKGLYSYYEKNLIPIDGFKEVHQISIFKPASLVLMLVDAKSKLVSSDLNHLINMTQCFTCTKPVFKFTNVDVNGLNGFHILQASKFSKQPKIAVATTKQLVILDYDFEQNEFNLVRILDTAQPTSCMLFTENSLIVGADKFFEVDLDRFQAEEFLDLSDVILRQALKCYKMGSFPVSIQQVSANPKEYLLCFNEFSVFVDEYGRSTRNKEIKSTHTPLAFYFIKSYLYVAQFCAIEVLKIKEETCNEEDGAAMDTFRFEIDKFKCVGCNKNGVYVQKVKEILLVDAKKHLDGDVSLTSASTEHDESDKFSFTSSTMQSLDGNLSDTESVDDRPRKVKFSKT